MLLTIGILVIVLLLIGDILWDFFKYKNWETIYMTQKQEEYMRAIGKLKMGGVKYRTKSNNSILTRRDPWSGRSNAYLSYEVLVAKKDVQKAHSLIHQR